MGRKRPEKKPGTSPVPRAAIPVDEEIDLHGMAVDEAAAAVEMALARHAGRRATLRLVHGHSSGDSGSIRGALRRNLGTVWSRKIASFRPEPGNPGATLVLTV